MMLTRRSLLFAPAVVAVGSIMPVRLWKPNPWRYAPGEIIAGAPRVPFRALYVADGGDLSLEIGGSIFTMTNVPAGVFLPILHEGVFQPGTTARIHSLA